ncbi:transglutaminaseTgpA domain-containing protein [Psychromicrobium lacuslunae]|uniref:transglutaminase family protein n=1 Tax=Psychromicrobium lacuslunae TaxID=1618207 RepID=UPI000697A618|nr:DUF3488 and transglutaminase-like domain-containing protein [Psychromicrobium lacuslunae]
MTATMSRTPAETGSKQPKPPKKRREKVGSAPWKMAAAICFACCGTAVGLTGVVRSGGWILILTFTVATVLAAMTLSRSLRLPGGWAPVFGVTALLVLLSGMFLNSTAFLGFIPTSASFDQLGGLFTEASEAVIRGVAPIPASPGVVLVICLGIGLAAILTDILAVGLLMPATSGLSLLVIALIPAIVKVDSLGVIGFVLGIIGYLLILVLSGRLRPETANNASAIPWGKVAGIGSITVVLSLLVSMLMPGFSVGTFPQGSRFNPFGPVAGLSPFLSLGSDLRNPSGTGQINYATSATSPPYLRTVTIENFDGENWEPTERGDGIQLSEQPIANDLDTSGVDFSTNITQINAIGFSNRWLPAPYLPTQINGLNGRWNVDPKTLSIKAIDQDTLGQVYTVLSLVPKLTPELLRKATSRPKPGFDPIFMTLPQNTPGIVKETALSLTSRQPTPYDKAMAIQQYLRGSEFSYSLQAPVSGGYDGSSMDALAKFLQQKSGYCVHFSAAMAVMAREAGIPSRIAVGFSPGAASGDTQYVLGQKLSSYTVDGRLAHAWPELYFEGLGWVPFEPTPSRGQVPSYAIPPSAPLPTDSAPDELPRPTASKSSSSAAAAPVPNIGQSPASQGVDFLWVIWPALVLVLLIPALSRLLLRRRRERLATPMSLWQELRDTAVDYGLPAERSDTPRRFVRRIKDSGLAGTPGPELTNLLREVERSSYGRPDDLSSSNQASTELARSRESFRLISAPGQRFKALLAPASTLRRWAEALSRPFRRRH